MSSTSILGKLSSELFEAEPILEGLMKKAAKKRELFRDYLRRVMSEEGLTDRQIDELTTKAGFRVSKSWVNLVLTQDQGVVNPGIKTLHSLAFVLNRSREEVEAAFMGEEAGTPDQLLANIEVALSKLSAADRDHYTRVLKDICDSMRRAAR